MTVAFKNKKLLWVFLAAIVLFFCFRSLRKEDDRFIRSSISKGDLRLVIQATGVVEPEEVVDVGAQVAGRVVRFGVDPQGKAVDFGSSVEEGTILAEIDPALYQADVDRATVDVQRADAELAQARARFAQAERDWRRAAPLKQSNALAANQFDAFLSAYELAKAGLAVGEASVLQSKTALAKAAQNLSYCTIKSPVKGVVIDRRVNTGQTVVSSLNAPSLFLIAKDLSKMQVWAAVNEADIGMIKEQMPVKFTIDAFPGEDFKGTVRKIRLNASMNQNVVSYTVEIDTQNESGKLLPYLTANVKFERPTREGVLLIPSEALRWEPPMQLLRESKVEMPKGKALWVSEHGRVRALPVTVGSSDGEMTEVSGNEIQEGLEVITGQKMREASSSGGTDNPLAPTVRRRPTANRG